MPRKPDASLQQGGVPAVHMSELRRLPVADRKGQSLGRLADVVVRLRGADPPLVTGLVATVARRQLFVPVGQVGAFGGAVLKLTSARLDLRHFERRPGEVLLRADVMGHRLIDVEAARLTRASDLELEQRDGDWLVTGVDSCRRRRGGMGLWRRGPVARPFREWSRFEPLIGHAGTAMHRGPLARLRRLKAAQIANVIEEASRKEEAEILGYVHADRDLEADVFEELDEDRAAKLLGARTDAEIADVVTRMRADDAADAIADLPQARRQPVLDLMPPGPRARVLALLGFNQGSAGGLMATELLAMPPATTARDALAAVSRSGTMQPEACPGSCSAGGLAPPGSCRAARQPRRERPVTRPDPDQPPHAARQSSGGRTSPAAGSQRAASATFACREGSGGCRG